MGSVTRAIECPNCKSMLGHHEYFYKSGEEEKWCFECGYQKSVRYKENENGEYVLHDPTKGFSLDNVVFDEFISDNPYGVVEIDFIGNKNDEMILLATEEQFLKVALDPLNSPDQANFQKVTLRRFINGQITKTVIYERNEENDSNINSESSSYLSNGDY